MENINASRKQLLFKLRDEYSELCTRAERLLTFINEAGLPESKAYDMVRKTLPQEHYNYLYDMKEQLKAMQKYAECLSYRIGYLNDEIQREESENQNGKQD